MPCVRRLVLVPDRLAEIDLVAGGQHADGAAHDRPAQHANTPTDRANACADRRAGKTAIAGRRAASAEQN